MLTAAAIKNAVPRERGWKLWDGGGLFLFVAPTGSKSWRLKYRWQRKEKLLSLGLYPAVTLPQARAAAAEAKAALARGVEPGKPGLATGGTFGQLARAWLEHARPSWSPAHAEDVEGSLDRHILPALEHRPTSAITAPELLALLRQVQAGGAVATAQRIRQRLSEIYAFAIAQGLVDVDPAAKLGAAMKDAPPARPHPALTTIEECRELLAACESVAARPATKLASRFLALTAVRLDAVRGARWEEVDLEAGTWTVPAARMKLARAKKDDPRFDHVVPLGTAARAVLDEASSLRKMQIAPAGGTLIFSATGAAPIGEGAIRELYRRAGFGARHVPHGWRASFSTILNEELGEGWRTAIDMALAHSAKGKVEAAYNRALLLDRRAELMQRWGELLAG